VAIVENLDVYLADWGAPVTFPGAPTGTVGIVDFHDVNALGGTANRGTVIGRVFGIFCKTTIADMLEPGVTITVGTTSYIVDDPKAQRDGAFAIVTLADAA
jgi:hypothetical protein